VSSSLASVASEKATYTLILRNQQKFIIL